MISRISWKSTRIARHFSTKKWFLPEKPVKELEIKEHGMPHFDKELISHLESLSLVRFTDEEAIASLRYSISRANRLLDIQLDDSVTPMETVWEDQDCPLFEDVAEPPLPVEKVLENAAVTQDDYFVTPPGNIPLAKSSVDFDQEALNSWDKIAIKSKYTPKH